MDNFSEAEHNLLRSSELLKGLSDKNFNTFLSLSHRAAYSKNETLLEEGKHSDYLYIVISGGVDLYKSTGTNQYLIGSLTSGQSIGEMRIIRNRPCSLTVTTSAPTVVLCVLLSKLRHLEYNQCYESILDSIIDILSFRLTHTNTLAVKGGANKKKSWKRYFFPSVVIATIALFLSEVGVAAYYLLT
ncbi:MAG: hypothetical protein LEGION0403_FIIPPAGN_02380 [Legionella sp.]|uniref:Crp/Fnr family transcriptional regulator n=1 Tax=Legionella sp. TaxID=459 RepID=UPI003D0F2426